MSPASRILFLSAYLVLSRVCIFLASHAVHNQTSTYDPQHAALVNGNFILPIVHTKNDGIIFDSSLFSCTSYSVHQQNFDFTFKMLPKSYDISLRPNDLIGPSHQHLSAFASKLIMFPPLPAAQQPCCSFKQSLVMSLLHSKPSNELPSHSRSKPVLTTTSKALYFLVLASFLISLAFYTSAMLPVCSSLKTLLTLMPQNLCTCTCGSFYRKCFPPVQLHSLYSLTFFKSLLNVTLLISSSKSKPFKNIPPTILQSLILLL